MWTTDCSAETVASPQAVWVALRALHSGERLSERSDRFELHGPFEKGTVATHRLEIDGKGADETGPQISEDFPVAMSDLLAFAGQNGSTAR
jgi:hypothetical protein